jgi:hypothetical protein
MATYNIYTAYGFNYDFSGGIAFVAKTKFSSSVDENIFEYVCPDIIKACTVIMFSDGMTGSSSITLQCLNENNINIPGIESKSILGPSIASTYTFQTPLTQGSKIRCRIDSTSFPRQNTRFEFCNITITL